MKFTALLPMKGESERVPNKNVRLFNGKPLFRHVLDTLIALEQVERVIINTDSKKIVTLCENLPKVIIHERPTELLGHMVPMNDIIAYDIEKSGAEFFIQTHSTNPLVKVETFQKGIDLFLAGNCDSVFSVTQLQTRLYWENGQAINHNPAELLRTQDLPPVFEENSNFFIFSKSSFKKAGNKRIGLSPKMATVNKLEALDIDEPEDFILAELAQKIVLDEHKG
jgi:CMP-N-acetylneuraminic acid synthetase